MGLCICVAIFRTILVKQLLNVLAMSVLSVMISSLHVTDLGKALFVCVLERMLFIVSHVFNVSFERQGCRLIFLSPSSFPFTGFLSFT